VHHPLRTLLYELFLEPFLDPFLARVRRPPERKTLPATGVAGDHDETYIHRQLGLRKRLPRQAGGKGRDALG
jgi:hypothetical protein